jgi:hypothetical protein
MLDGHLPFRCQPRRAVRGQQRHGLAPFRDQDFLPAMHARKQFGELVLGLTLKARKMGLNIRNREAHQLAEELSKLKAKA